MDRIVINGGNRLNGLVKISGMKNSALPIIFACLLIPEECVIHNIPKVSDVVDSLEILRSMGAYAEFCGEHSVLINTKNATATVGATQLVCKMRASSYLMSVMLSRFGAVDIPLPGGCNFGARPLDLHFKGFKELGAECNSNEGKIEIFSRNKLKSKKIRLDKISVGATINMVLAAAMLDGVTVIQNCACEPHVDDLISFLNSCGAKIFRQNQTIVCFGQKSLHGTEYSIFPDMIEALTYIACVGACGGCISLKDVVPLHLRYEIDMLKKMGFSFSEYEKNITVSCGNIRGVCVKTAPYPYFPTDFHPQFATLLCFCDGGGVITDEIFPSRFAYADELRKLGAKINVVGNTAYIRKSKLLGAEIDATDLRAGAALVLGGLGAEGESTINNINYIVRGYENIVEKIVNIGGNIKLLKENKNGSN